MSAFLLIAGLGGRPGDGSGDPTACGHPAEPSPADVPATPWPPAEWRAADPPDHFGAWTFGCCCCYTWSDTFDRDAIGDEWEVISGTWSAVPGPLPLNPLLSGRLITSSDLATILTSRRRDLVTLGLTIASSSLGRGVRLIFDWTDAANYWYAEWTASTIAIYQVDAGETILLAGPETWITGTSSSQTLAVQIAATATEGQRYVQAIGLTGYAWTACLCDSDLASNKCGIQWLAPSYYDPTSLEVDAFGISDCARVAAAKPENHCYYAKPIDLAVLAGTITAGSLASLQDAHPNQPAMHNGSPVETFLAPPPLDVLSASGIVDLVIQFAFIEAIDPRYAEVWIAPHAGVTWTLACWNFVRERWEATTDAQVLAESSPYTAFTRFLTDEHVSPEGVAALRVVGTDPSWGYGSEEWTAQFRLARAARDELVLPEYLVVDLSSNLPTHAGTYQCVRATYQPLIDYWMLQEAGPKGCLPLYREPPPLALYIGTRAYTWDELVAEQALLGFAPPLGISPDAQTVVVIALWDGLDGGTPWVRPILSATSMRDGFCLLPAYNGFGASVTGSVECARFCRLDATASHDWCVEEEYVPGVGWTCTATVRLSKTFRISAPSPSP